MNHFMVLSSWFFTCPFTPLWDGVDLGMFFDSLSSGLMGPVALYQEVVRVRGTQDSFPLTVLFFTPEVE